MVSKTLTLVVCFIALGMINAAEEKHDHYHHDHHEDFDSRHHVDHGNYINMPSEILLNK